jgi:hypothetical protein
MKKIPKTSTVVTMTVVLLLMANLCFCQIKYGLQESLTISNVNIKNNANIKTSAVFGYALNVHMALKGEDDIGISIEPGFMMKGCIMDHNTNIDNIRVKLGYLSVPVLMNWYINDHFILSSGTEFGYLLIARYKNNDGVTNVWSNYNKPEVSVILGLAYRFIDKVDVALRTSKGLTTSMVEKIIGTNENSYTSKSYNRYPLQLILRYKL